MAQRLKRWESPRKQGRNDKGRGGAARQRQLKKKTQVLRKQLQEGSSSGQAESNHKKQNRQNKQTKEGSFDSLPFLMRDFGLPFALHQKSAQLIHRLDFFVL